VPNTLVPGLRGLDWAAMGGMFNNCLSSSPIPNASDHLDENTGVEELEFDHEDVTLKNLEGEGAMKAAEQWAESRKMIKTLEVLREYLTGRKRMLVDLVLRRTTKSPSDPKRRGSRAGVGFKRYGDSDEDTDNSDVEDARGRTAHQLFADDTGAETGAYWHTSSSQSNDESSTNVRLSLAPPASNIRNWPLSPTSSPVRIGSTTQDKGKRRQLDPPGVAEQKQEPVIQFGPTMQLPPTSSYQSYSVDVAMNSVGVNSAFAPDHLITPFADVNNVLGKRSTLHTPPRSSTPSGSAYGTPTSGKRVRVDMDLGNSMVENQSPNSDHFMYAGHGDDSCAERAARVVRRDDGMADPSPQVAESMYSLLPLALPSKRRLSLLANGSPTPPSGDKQRTPVERVSHSTLNSERFQIANKLSRARPDLVASSYAPKRTGQLSWSMRSEVREQYQDGLRSISYASVADTSVETAVSDRSPRAKDAFEDDSSMDWERSRVLKDTVLAQLGRGEPVLLPALACLDSQLPGAT
jgi:hypothetical protein